MKISLQRNNSKLDIAEKTIRKLEKLQHDLYNMKNGGEK